MSTENDNENLSLGKTPAVFPELPFPFNHLYARFKNLNGNDGRDANGSDYDLKPHPAVEVGLRFDF